MKIDPHVSKELREFVARIPSKDAIRERLKQTEAETRLLRRVLRLAADKEEAGNG